MKKINTSLKNRHFPDLKATMTIQPKLQATRYAREMTNDNENLNDDSQNIKFYSGYVSAIVWT